MLHIRRNEWRNRKPVICPHKQQTIKTNHALLMKHMRSTESNAACACDSPDKTVTCRPCQTQTKWEHRQRGSLDEIALWRSLIYGWNMLMYPPCRETVSGVILCIDGVWPDLLWEVTCFYQVPVCCQTSSFCLFYFQVTRLYLSFFSFS